MNEMRRVKHDMHGFLRDGVYPNEYYVWVKMKQRCYNPNDEKYPRYGARGIRVCERWLHHYENFIKDMGPCPPGYSLDRINNDLGYFPENCRWATRIEQANNQARVVILVYNGQSGTLTEWSHRLGINRRTLKGRRARGWSAKRILTTPVMGGG